MYRKRYTVRAFSRLIKTQAYEDLTYIVNGFVFIHTGIMFRRMNDDAMNYRKIIEFEEFAEENNQPTMLVFLGENHTKMMCDYFDVMDEVKADECKKDI